MGPADRAAHVPHASSTSSWCGSRSRWTPTTTKAMPRWRRQFDTPIATGEMLTSAAEHGDLIRHRAADCLMPDAPRVGGITPFLKIAAQAEHAGLMLAPHFAMELHVHLAAAYAARALGRAFRLAGAAVQRTPGDRATAACCVPTRPGLGLTLSEQAHACDRGHAPDRAARRPLSEPAPMPRRPPLTIRMHERDNVAIVANDGGLPAGTRARRRAWCCASACRRATRWRWPTSPRTRRCCATASPIGYALQAHPRRQLGARARCCRCPTARGARRPAASRPSSRAPLPPLEGYTFEGYRNADGSVGTRNILAITHDGAVRGRRRRLRGAAHQGRAAAALSRTSTTWSPSSTRYGCGVAIDAPGAEIPIRTLRNISLNPNFGGEVMVVSLGCEKLQPERLLPPGSFAIVDERNVADVGDSAGAAGRRAPAGRRACRLHVDGRVDHAPGRSAPASA